LEIQQLEEIKRVEHQEQELLTMFTVEELQITGKLLVVVLEQVKAVQLKTEVMVTQMLLMV
jgi:hypothetical protein